MLALLTLRKFRSTIIGLIIRRYIERRKDIT